MLAKLAADAATDEARAGTDGNIALGAFLRAGGEGARDRCFGLNLHRDAEKEDARSCPMAGPCAHVWCRNAVIGVDGCILLSRKLIKKPRLCLEIQGWSAKRSVSTNN